MLCIQAAGVVVGGAVGAAAGVAALGAVHPRRSPRRSLDMGAQAPAPAELTHDQGAMLQHLSAGAHRDSELDSAPSSMSQGQTPRCWLMHLSPSS